jgi:hypothetical protein
LEQPPDPERTMPENEKTVNSISDGKDGNTDDKVQIELDEGTVTHSMQAGYALFWQLVLGRLLAKSPGS